MTIIKKAFILPFLCILLFAACNTATPEKYFDLAVLNCNMITGIAGNGSMSELEYPSVKLVEGTKDQTVVMTRKEMIETKIKWVEEGLEKLKGLKETEDTKEMIQTSVSLYEYVLPIYKTEYLQLAKLYDENAPKEQIQQKAQAIHDKYSPTFIELFDKLTTIGKSFAARHKINVNWDVKTSPTL